MAKILSFSRDVRKAFDELAMVLRNLNFRDNFSTFEWEGEIAASAEKKIPHKLGRIPSGYVIVKNKGAPILQGDTPWTSEYVYLKNYSGAVTASGTVLFFI